MPNQEDIANQLQRWCIEQLGVIPPNLDSTRPSHEPSLTLQALRVEASHRHFYRLINDNSNERWVAMWSPPALENNEQFATLASVFMGLGTPQLLASDFQRGFFLMQDLGSEHLSDLYTQLSNNPEQMQALVERALDALIPLQQIRHPAIPAYEADRLVTEFDLCGDWFAYQLADLPLSSEEQKTLSQARDILVSAMLEQPQVCVHRDYHCRNLLLCDNGPSSYVGIVDFQDALIGPILYDPASLLRDCYFKHHESLIETTLRSFAGRSPALANIPPQTIVWWLDACAIQRTIKAVGIFARLHLRDGKSSHLQYIPPVLARTAKVAMKYPSMMALSQLLEGWSTKAQTRIWADTEANENTSK